jgi:transcriptional regulator with XRE-family HTH domain
MQPKTLGEFIRKKRDDLDISLRELARRLDVSAPFISDVELGRRNPSDDILSKIATEFKIRLEELKRFDHRESLAEFKRILETNPNVAVAFRTAVEEYKEGKRAPEDLVQKSGKDNRKK